MAKTKKSQKLNSMAKKKAPKKSKEKANKKPGEKPKLAQEQAVQPAYGESNPFSANNDGMPPDMSQPDPYNPWWDQYKIMLT